MDASNLQVEELAKQMNEIINDPQRYYDFFRWHGHYTFDDTLHRYSVCELCYFLNNLNGTAHVRKNILKWWNVPRPVDFPNGEAFRDYMPEEPVYPFKPLELVISLVSKIWNYFS